MLAIEMIGGIYCPLSPRDPEHRLHSLITQTKAHLLFVHHATKTKFNDSILLFDLDTLLIDNLNKKTLDIDRLSNVVITNDHIAYIIFTSGSTGIPKAVS